MAGRDHQAASCLELIHQPGHRRGGAQAKGPHLTARRSQASLEGGHEHGPTAAGIHPQQHRGIAREHLTAPVAHLHGQSRGHHGAHAAANAIGTEADATTSKGLAHRMGRQIGHARNFVPAEIKRVFQACLDAGDSWTAVCLTPALGPPCQEPKLNRSPQQQAPDHPTRQPNQRGPRPQQPTQQSQAHSQRSAPALQLPGRHLGQSRSKALPSLDHGSRRSAAAPL